MFLENRHIPDLIRARERYAKHRAAAGHELVTLGYVEEPTPYQSGTRSYDLSTALVDSASGGLAHRVRARASIMGLDVDCDCEGHDFNLVCWHIAALLDALEVAWCFEHELAPSEVTL